MPLHIYKVVLNTRFGGFGLSKACALWLANLCEHHEHLRTGEIEDLHRREENRTCPYLVECVERNAAWASGEYSRLVVDEVWLRWGIKDHDGRESIDYGY